ncbi:MAG: HPF/RaiA family ribosome-associated protein [Patescibacteria group bacterium]
MRLNTRSKNLTEPEKEQFETYLEEKLRRVTRMMDSHYPDPDTVKIDATIEKFDKHTAFAFEYVLEMPRHKPFFARQVKHSVTESMDRATDMLEKQLVKHFKKLTREG